MFLLDATQTEVPTERLEAEVTELAGHLAAAECRWLGLVAELDRREAWASWGCRSCAHWLSWQCGLTLGPARERVRVARALEHLPRTVAEFSAGRLSYSQVRAMTRVATPDNERVLLDLARFGTAGQLETAVRAYRGVLDDRATERANDRHARRSCDWHWDDDGCLVLRARLSPEDGAVVVKALEEAKRSLADEERANAPVGDVPAGTPEGPDRVTARRADALLRVAEASLAAGLGARSGGERTMVVVHVGAEVLAGENPDGRCHVEDGPALSPETARRQACDSSVVTITEADGEPLSVGRRTRSIPPAIRRALEARDEGCVFPGCGARRYVEGHHVQHWAEGGETSLANLVSLCWAHHRAVHEGGFRLDHDGHGTVTVRDADGRLLEPLSRAIDPADGGLVRRNAEAGLAIDAETIPSDWGGEHLDLDEAVRVLVQADGSIWIEEL